MSDNEYMGEVRPRTTPHPLARLVKEQSSYDARTDSYLYRWSFNGKHVRKTYTATHLGPESQRSWLLNARAAAHAELLDGVTE